MPLGRVYLLIVTHSAGDSVALYCKVQQTYQSTGYGCHACSAGASASARVPTETVPLLVIDLLQYVQGSRSTVVRASSEKNVDETGRRSIGIAERSFHRGQEAFMRETRDRRHKSIGNAHAVSAVGASLL